MNSETPTRSDWGNSLNCSACHVQHIHTKAECEFNEKHCQSWACGKPHLKTDHNKSLADIATSQVPNISGDQRDELAQKIVEQAVNCYLSEFPGEAFDSEWFGVWYSELSPLQSALFDGNGDFDDIAREILNDR